MQATDMGVTVCEPVEVESRRCSRDTYPESYITEYILIYEDNAGDQHGSDGVRAGRGRENLLLALSLSLSIYIYISIYLYIYIYTYIER